MAIIETKAISNPFNYNNPTPPDKFLGRFHTVNEIVADLYDAQSSSHAVIAGRRCGKTSLLHALHEKLRTRLTTTDVGEWHLLPVFIDLQAFENTSPFTIYQGFIREIGRVTTKKKGFFGHAPLLSLQLNTDLIEKYCGDGVPNPDFDDFKEFTGHLAEQAQAEYGPLRFVFLIDEVEEISEKEWTNQLFANFRSLMNNPIMKPYFRFVMVGSQRFLRVQRRPGSPLFNMLDRHHLTAFSEDTTRQLIAWGGQFSSPIIQEVITLSGGHPYIVQFIMYHLWVQRATATVEEVRSIGHKLCSQYSDILNGWYEAIGPEGQKVFLVMASSKQSMTLRAIRKGLAKGVDLQEGLTTLEYHNLIIKDEKKYQYRSGSELFCQWFLEKRNVNDTSSLPKTGLNKDEMMNQSVDIAILTVLPEEYVAVHKRVLNPRSAPATIVAPNLYAWVLAEVPYQATGDSYSIALGMMGRAGTSSAVLATKDTIARFQPRYIFFVGIAGGFDLDGLKKGDVVIADTIYGYEYGKVEKTFQPRYNWTYRTDQALLTNTTAFAVLNPNWAAPIQDTHPEKEKSKVLSGTVASGDKVVDDPTNEFFAKIKEAWPKLQAVEMEGAGVAMAIEQIKATGTSVGFLMIRGICDMPRADAGAEETQGTRERDTWKDYAAHAAALFTISFIANNHPVPPQAK